MEENRAVASLFDNDDDVQESGDVDDGNPDVDMIPAKLHSRHSSMSDHHSVPPTTDSDHDITMPDYEDSEPEAADQRNHRQPSSKFSVRRQKAFLEEVCSILSGYCLSATIHFI